ncbi:hypothetical protein [Paraburkholderia lacunae]|uniref:Uncharacterized protein n=1 Tax=Paraburkholderia lacunae TaxID=2211104 RepID=A0A370NGC1_9BURK|nr:hypothetical protein [Paraburkholderia lacunae]RDK04598.1 hypothetical protein DLM46_01640 [Paraburkholderia lacunae]
MKAKSIAVCCLCVISSTAFARGAGLGGGHSSYHSSSSGGHSSYHSSSSGGHSSYHSSSSGEHYVSGYTRSNGTYVSGHHQTNPNGTKYDNWSSKGNVNPYTGKKGTVDPSK